MKFNIISTVKYYNSSIIHNNKNYSFTISTIKTPQDEVEEIIGFEWDDEELFIDGIEQKIYSAFLLSVNN